MRIKKYILALLLAFAFTLNVNAASLSLEPDSNTISEDGNIKVNIKLNLGSGESVDKVQFKLAYDKSLLRPTLDNNSFGYAQALTDDSVFIAASEKLSSGNIGTIIITALTLPDDVSYSTKTLFQITNIEFKNKETSTSGDSIQKEFTIRNNPKTTTAALNTSAKLSGFTVANTTIKPAFDKSIKDYKIYVNKDTIKQITIKPTTEQTGATFSVSCTMGCTPDSNVPNKINISMGKNVAIFTLTSEDGKNTEIYKFTIYRGETTDGSNFLASLNIKGFNINEEFDKNKLDYTATVSYETESIEIDALGEDENADIQIKGNENLKVGENVITITVTSAETEEKKIYNITVTRQEFKEEENTTTSPVIKTENKKKNNTLLIVLLIVGSTLIIGLAAYFIFFYKKKDKKKASELKSEEEKKEALAREELLQKTFTDLENESTSVDDALRDLMKTKEISDVDKES